MADKGSPELLILPEPLHLGYVTRDIERTKRNMQRMLGLGSFTMMSPNYFNKTYRGEPEDFRTQLAVCKVGNVVYELIQVLQGRTVYDEFLKEHGEGIHHLGYEISDLARWLKAYKNIGVEVVMSGERAAMSGERGGLKFAYLNTPEITVELIARAEGQVA